MTSQNMNDVFLSKRARTIFWLLLMGSASFLRMPNLGKLGLWGDEGFTAISAAAILEHGYPLLPSGGIYPRALLFSYIEAFSAKIFGLNEFALRFPNTIFGLAGIWMTYLLGQRLYGKRVGYVAAVLMAFSIWEITFSRYARMYVFFQFFYLLSIYFFYRGFIEGERFYRRFTPLLWILTITIHQIGVSLAALLLIPFFIDGYHHVKKWKLILGVGGLALVWKLYISFQAFLRSPVVSTSDSGKAAASKLPIALPPLNLWLEVFQKDRFIFYLLCGLVILCVSFFVFRACSKSNQCMQYLFFTLILLACFFHQIALAFVLLVFYSLMFFNQTHSWRQRPFLLACTVVFLSLIGWVSYAIHQDFTIRKTVSLLFQYPYLYERFLKFFLKGWPLVTFLTGLGLFLSWYHFINDRAKHTLLMGFSSVVAPLLFVSLLYREDDAARYSFHLYPLMLILSAYALVHFLQRFVPRGRLNFFIMPALLVLFLIPGDFQLSYAISNSQNSYGKEIVQAIKTPGYTFHPDYKTPSHYIRDNLSDDELVISMIEAISVYYVGRIDYLWIPKENDAAAIRPHGFTGKLPRIRFVELQKILKENTGRQFWLLEDPLPTAKLKNNTSILAFMESISLCGVSKGKDGKTTAYHFYADKTGQAACIET